MKKPFILLLLAIALISCSEEPCEDLSGDEKVSCIQCEETGRSSYLQIVEKPVGFASVNLDSLLQYGRDSLVYQGGSYAYRMVYGQYQCTSSVVIGLVIIETDGPFEHTIGSWHEMYDPTFRYRVTSTGTIIYAE